MSKPKRFLCRIGWHSLYYSSIGPETHTVSCRHCSYRCEEVVNL